MSLEHTTRAITENKFNMQLFADKKSLEVDIAMMKNLKASNPNDARVSDYDIKQKEYELSQIERRIKGKDYSSVKTQCEQYFQDNSTLFDKNQVISETRSMLSRGQTVNEWPHLAAVFLLDHASVTDQARQDLAAVKPVTAPPQKVPTQESVSPGETIVVPEKKVTKPDSVKQAKPQPLAAPTVQSKPENVPEILTVQQKIVFKDGAYYLTGPKGNARRVEVSELLVNLNLPKDAPENLKKSVGIIDDFSLILDSYITANPKEKAKYEGAVKSIQELFAQEDIQSGKKILDVTSITKVLFSDNNFLKDSDLYRINTAFRSTDANARRLAVLSFIRDNLGQSDVVLQEILKNNASYFAFPEDKVILENGDISAAGLSISGRKSVQDTIRKARLEAASNWNKHYVEYMAQFKAQNPGVQVNEESARVENEKLTVLMLAKREIMYQKLYNKDLKGELALAQDIMGASTWDMSDKAWDMSKEVGGMIAMEAIAIAAGVVTAGAATVAINAAMLGRNAYRGIKAIEAYNAATKTRKVLTTSARILSSGVGFEAGAATTRSYIENGDFTSMHSMEGYAQSVAMMGVMSGIGKLVTSGKLGSGIQFKEGMGFTKNIIPFSGQVALDGAAIFGTSATIGAVFFDRRDNWTLEQMAQAMLMAALFKGAGRLTAGKNSKGEVEVKQTTEKPATTTKKDVIPEGTFKSDSKVDLASFTTREITATDVRRAKVLIKNGEYPQFIGKDGDIWTIRAVTGRSGSEVVEIGPLGQVSLDKRATIQEFVEGVNANVRKINSTLSKFTEIKKPKESIATSIQKKELRQFSSEEITLNKNLSLDNRIKKAEDLLGSKLNNEQKEAIQAAHNVGIPEANGSFSAANLRLKLRILGKNQYIEGRNIETFTQEQRSLLMRSGLAGKPVDYAAAIAKNPESAAKAIESVSTSNKKIGELYSDSVIKEMADKLGKSVGWVADKSVGPFFRIITGNNPSSLLSLAIPKSGYLNEAKTYGTNLAQHWSHPLRNSVDLLITGERKDGQGILGKVLKNSAFAGGIAATEYFSVPDQHALNPEQIGQNYYEMILLGWLGIVIMEKDTILATAEDMKDWVSDRIQAKPF